MSRVPSPLNFGMMHTVQTCQIHSSRITGPELSAFLVHVWDDGYSNSTSPLDEDGVEDTEVPAKHPINVCSMPVPLSETFVVFN